MNVPTFRHPNEGSTAISSSRRVALRRRAGGGVSRRIAATMGVAVPRESGRLRGRLAASGRLLGWLDGEDLYLDPDAAYAEVQRLADEQGTRSRSTRTPCTSGCTSGTCWPASTRSPAAPRSDARSPGAGVPSCISAPRGSWYHPAAQMAQSAPVTKKSSMGHRTVPISGKPTHGPSDCAYLGEGIYGPSDWAYLGPLPDNRPRQRPNIRESPPPGPIGPSGPPLNT